MTDRVNSLTVVLDHEMRTDDVEALVDAIGMMQNVADVVPTPVATGGDYILKSQLRSVAQRKLIEAICDILNPRSV